MNLEKHVKWEQYKKLIMVEVSGLKPGYVAHCGLARWPDNMANMHSENCFFLSFR